MTIDIFLVGRSDAKLISIYVISVRVGLRVRTGEEILPDCSHEGILRFELLTST